MRKNRGRTKTGKENRSKLGRRLDAIIRDDGDSPYEYGGIEVAGTFTGDTSTKWLTDRLKLAKALHDMLSRLHHHVKENDIAKELQVVGLLNSGKFLLSTLVLIAECLTSGDGFLAGLTCKVLRVSYAGGYLSLLSCDEPEVLPTAAASLKDLLELLLSIWRMKVSVLFFFFPSMHDL